MNTQIIPEEVVESAYQMALTNVRSVKPTGLPDLSESEKKLIEIGCWAGVTEVLKQTQAWLDKNTSIHSE